MTSIESKRRPGSTAIAESPVEQLPAPTPASEDETVEAIADVGLREDASFEGAASSPARRPGWSPPIVHPNDVAPTAGGPPNDADAAVHSAPEDQAAVEADRRSRPPSVPRPARRGGGQGFSGVGQPRIQGATFDGVPVTNQNDLSGNVRLNHVGASLSSKGCVLTSFAMVLSKATGVHVDPERLNDELAGTGAFMGGSLVIPEAARLVGLQASEKLDPHAPGFPEALKQLNFDQGVLLVRVDYEPVNGGGDHTVIFTSYEDGVFHGIDPAGGFEIQATFDGDGNLVGRGAREFMITNMRIIEPEDGSMDDFPEGP